MFFELITRNSRRSRKENGLFFTTLLVSVIAFYIILSLSHQDVMLFLKTMESDAVNRLLTMIPVFYVMTYSYYEVWQKYIVLFSIGVFLFFSPIKNRSLEENEYKRYKLISIFLLIICFLLIYLQIYNSIIAYVILIVSILMIVCIKKNEK